MCLQYCRRARAGPRRPLARGTSHAGLGPAFGAGRAPHARDGRPRGGVALAGREELPSEKSCLCHTPSAALREAISARRGRERTSEPGVDEFSSAGVERSWLEAACAAGATKAEAEPKARAR